jgi:pyruvate/2-oxoglutarate/acetoin dehydrogenase E1 component
LREKREGWGPLARPAFAILLVLRKNCQMLPGGWDLHLPKVTVITPFRQASGRRVIQSVKNIRNLVAVESGYPIFGVTSEILALAMEYMFDTVETPSQVCCALSPLRWPSLLT